MEEIARELEPLGRDLEEAKAFVEKLNKNLKDAEAMLGGSLAMGTNMKDKHDADIFVRYNEKGNLSDRLETTLKELKQKYQRIHGSRDYFQIENKITYEVVPVLKVNTAEEAETVVDMSPLHVEYFNNKAKQNTRKDVRLAKALCKAKGIYGAESHIQGFSGHVLNILTLYYGSFKELLEKATNWKDKTIIDIERKHKDPLMELDKAKTQGPLIVVDPVQDYRNAAAAVSKEAFQEFKKTAKEFLKKPSKEHFQKRPLKPKPGSIMIKLKPLNEKEDIAGSKILKIKQYIERKLKENDFEIKWSDWEYGEEANIAIQSKPIEKEKTIQGPPLEFKEHVEEFKSKYKDTYENNGKIYAKTKRKHTKPEALIKELLKDEYVKERCKTAKDKIYK